ncbi:MAG TPA: ABC transporter permease [Acidimicrobiia bacterium]|nr:ABC transporter permease [Acidimicrobiia bacterium]
MIEGPPRAKPMRSAAVAAAFLRVDFVEDVSYPLWLVLRHVAVIIPVFIYYFIGELVGGAPTVGGDYFTFAMIGLALTTVLQAVLTGFGWALGRAQTQGTFETLLVEPVPWIVLPFAMNLWRVLLGVITGGVVFAIGLVLGARIEVAGIPAFLLILVLGLLASVGIGTITATFMVLSKRAEPLVVLYGLVASVLGGALFSVDQLPRVLQVVSWAVPHTYVINAARDVLMADSGSFTIPMGSAVLALGIFDVVSIAGGLWLLSRSMQYARKMGLLSGY